VASHSAGATISGGFFNLFEKNSLLKKLLIQDDVVQTNFVQENSSPSRMAGKSFMPHFSAFNENFLILN
ncbi:hypothetical protein J7M00_04870, partial [bacterium]|nr:hypothetical protein [bacterium]